MFKHLYDVARHTPLHLIITPNGPQLRIIVTPKPTGEAANNAALAKPFSCTGTPEELDAEFPAAIQQYTQGVNDLRAKLELPLSDLEAAAKKAEKKEAAKSAKEQEKKAAEEKRKAAAQQAAKTRADNAAKKKAEAERKAKERADARAARKAKPSLPGATTPPAGEQQAPGWPFPTGSGAPSAAEREAAHRPGLPGKPECVRDYRQMKLKHGDKLTRRLFIKKSETGRRYEKLWPNWEKFVKEAGAQAELPLDESTRAAESASASGAEPGESPGARSAAAPLPEFDATEERTSDGAGEPMVPTAGDTLTQDDPPRKGEGAGTHTDVYDEFGGYMSSITTKPALGEHIGLVSQPHLLRITKIETRPSGGLDVTVVPDPAETARRAQAIADSVRAQAADSPRRTIPIVEAQPTRGQRCDGCAHNIYSAPHGQPPLKPAPHSRCKFFDADIPMIVDGRGTWLRSEIPAGCPTFDPAKVEQAPVPQQPPADSKPYKVYTPEGTFIAESKYPYTLGEKLQHNGVDVVIDQVEGPECRRYIARSPAPAWKICSPDGTVLATLDHEPAIGERITIGEQTYAVFDVDGHECSAGPIKRKAPAETAAAVTQE